MDNTIKHLNSVTKLKGAENYKVWAIQLDSLIKGHSLQRYVEGTRAKPAGRLTNETQEAFEDRQDVWSQKDNQARSLIIQSCVSSVILALEPFKTSQEAWSYLQTKYAPQGLAHKYTKWGEWIGLTFDGRDLENFCTKYTTALTACKESDLAIDNEIALYQFIRLISPYFDGFASNQRQKLREKTDSSKLPSLDQLIADLLDEHLAQRDSYQANFARNRGGKSDGRPSTGTGNNGGTKRYCKECKTTTHNTDKCFELHPELRPDRWKSKAEYNKAKGSSSSGSGGSGDKKKIITQHTFFSNEAVVSALVAAESTSSWIIDSGSSTHMTPFKDLLFNDEPINGSVNIGKGHLDALAVGSVTLHAVTEQGVRAITLTNVLWVPDLCANLLSTEKLRQKGLFYRNDQQVLFTDNGEALAEVYAHNNLPHLRLESALKTDEAMVTSSEPSTSKATYQLWHQRTHMPLTKLETAADTSTGMVLTGTKELLSCSDCKQADGKRIRSRIPTTRPLVPYEEVSTDVVTVSNEGVGRVHYYTLFTDSTTLYRHVYFSPTKDGAGHHFKQHDAYTNTQLGRRTKRYRIDGGREYGRNQLKAYAVEHGIELMMTTPHNSEQNGRAEVSNHIVNTLARKLMLQGQLPQLLWPEAVKAAVYLLNIMPSDTLGKSPWQALAELEGFEPHQPYLGHLKAYGCAAYVLDHGVRRGDKFKARSKAGQLVGYEGTNIYLVWLPDDHKVVRSTNVTFDESKFVSSSITDVAVLELSTDEPEPATTPSSPPASLGGEQEHGNEAASEQENEALDTQVPDLGQQQLRQSNRLTRKSAALLRSEQSHYTTTALPLKSFYALTAAVDTSEVITPNTYAEAMATPEAAHWQAACESEISSLVEHETWKLVKMPTTGNANLVKGRWVFKVKRNKNGQLDRYKARWVARGFSQVEGVDYDDTYASVAKPSSIRAFMALIAEYDLEARQYDVLTAFLNSQMRDHTIYVEQPHGFAKDGSLVCLLLRGLYGLKQSPLLWYNELKNFLQLVSFEPLWSDACVFRDADGTLILIYVDDVLIAATKTKQIEAAASRLSSKFNLQSLGELSFYLGSRIIRNRKSRQVFMVQDAYFDQMLEKYHLADEDPADTPLDPYQRIEAAPEGYKASKNLTQRYQSLVGKEMWPAMQTRPDIAYAVAVLAQYLQNPTNEHMAQAKRCARYIKKTKKYGICFTGNGGCHLTGYADASHADDITTRRSTGAHVFMLSGGPLSWKSGRLPLVTLSSTESEYCSLTLAAKEAIAMARLLTEMEYTDTTEPVTIFEDSKPAIDLTKKPAGADGRTKHIELRWHFIRQAISNGEVKVEWLPTDQQVADGLTKPLDRIKFERFREQIGVVDCTTVISAAA